MLTLSAVGLRRLTHLHFPRGLPPNLLAVRLHRPADGMDIRAHRPRVHHRLALVPLAPIQATPDPAAKPGYSPRAPAVVAALSYVVTLTFALPLCPC